MENIGIFLEEFLDSDQKQLPTNLISVLILKRKLSKPASLYSKNVTYTVTAAQNELSVTLGLS